MDAVQIEPHPDEPDAGYDAGYAAGLVTGRAEGVEAQRWLENGSYAALRRAREMLARFAYAGAEFEDRIREVLARFDGGAPREEPPVDALVLVTVAHPDGPPVGTEGRLYRVDDEPPRFRLAHLGLANDVEVIGPPRSECQRVADLIAGGS